MTRTLLLADDNEESHKKGSDTAMHYNLNKDSLNSTRTRHVNGRNKINRNSQRLPTTRRRLTATRRILGTDADGEKNKKRTVVTNCIISMYFKF